MIKHIGKDTITATIEYFRARKYKKPEQIGLFFYFKANGLNDLLYVDYEKWGEMPSEKRQTNLQNLYDLSAMFDLKKESGLKRSALFPFSISNDIKGNAFYNGATPFASLGSRISDTLDNALVSTFIKRNTSSTKELKLQEGYVDLLLNDYLLGNKIPLEYLAAWVFKFWDIEMPSDTTNEDFKDVCVLAFLEKYFISVKEFQAFFFFGNKKIAEDTNMISGKDLRQAIKFSNVFAPEIGDEPATGILPFNRKMTESDTQRLLQERGEAPLTTERIIEILSARDAELQQRYNETGIEEQMPEEQVETEAILPDYDINQLGRILTEMYNSAENKSTAIHMFGIKYGAIIRRNGYTSVGLIAAATGINESYHAELSKGLRIYESMLNNEYGVKFYSGDAQASRENSTCLPVLRARTQKQFPLNCILYGAPGTGKTYATAQYALAIIENKEVNVIASEKRSAVMERYNKAISSGRIVFTTFHQNYGYEDFIQGIRPDTDSRGMSFKTVDGVFKSIADHAIKKPELDYVLIIDEINRANISKVFGELITLIEEDKRWGEENAINVTLPSGDIFAVPNNLFIVGTMNSADKSISLIDTALRRRFVFIEYTPNLQLVSDIKLRKVLETINAGIAAELNSTDLLVGHSYFMGKSEDDLCDIMNRSIIPLLYEYFFDNHKKVEAQVKKAIEGLNVEIESSSIGRIKLVKKGD